VIAASWIASALGLYVAAGGCFALVFLWRGIERLDAATKGAGMGFRVLVFPGTIALWPFLLRAWMKADHD